MVEIQAKEMVISSEEEYEKFMLVGSGCAGLTIGDGGAVAEETRLILDGAAVETITVDAGDPEAAIKAVLEGGSVAAVQFAEGSTFASMELLASGGGDPWMDFVEDQDLALRFTGGKFTPKDALPLHIQRGVYTVGGSSAENPEDPENGLCEVWMLFPELADPAEVTGLELRGNWYEFPET